MMADMLKIAVLGVAAALCAVVVRKSAAELGVVLALAAGAVILSGVLGALEAVRVLIDTLADTAGLSPAVVAPVIKTVGIAILTHIAVQVCKDAGEGGIAAVTETAGSALALCTALPLLRAVLDTIAALL